MPSVLSIGGFGELGELQTNSYFHIMPSFVVSLIGIYSGPRVVSLAVKQNSQFYHNYAKTSDTPLPVE